MSYHQPNKGHFKHQSIISMFSGLKHIGISSYEFTMILENKFILLFCRVTENQHKLKTEQRENSKVYLLFFLIYICIRDKPIKSVNYSLQEFYVQRL